MIIPLKNPAQAAKLFSRQESGLVQACLSGSMGGVYVPKSSGAPESALCMLGDFAIYGGVPSPELLSFNPVPGKTFAILLPTSEGWEELIVRLYAGKCTPKTRYAFLPENTCFCPEKLEDYLSNLPGGYCLKQIDRELFPVLLREEWSRDFVSQFADGEDFSARGLGYAAFYQGKPVGGASSYCIYPGGLEIETDVLENHRQRGLATACGAALILHCLQKGICPHWDAANPVSVKLAQKLGYRRPEPYAAFHTHHFAAFNCLHNEHSPAQFD